MNRFAYRMTSLAVKTLSSFSKLRVSIHGEENIPEGSIIFVINHFTRIETLFLPYHINQLTSAPVWSLADYALFKGPLAVFLDKIGVVSTKNPDRDLLIVKSLLTGEATWVIYPEGRMVKNKKIIEKSRYMISHAGGKHPPHTGAATLALRTEFYRERLKVMTSQMPDEARRLIRSFKIDSIEPVLKRSTYIVPVNITYYPMKVQENIVSNLFSKFLRDLSERAVEEIMAEGTMLLSGVDVDIRFGEPIEIRKFLSSAAIIRDISAKMEIDFDDPIPSKQVMRRVVLRIMSKYMSAIYAMTTLNHDHLFASMLRAIPFKKIDEDDLRRRVFLAANLDLDKMGIFRHRYLGKDQVHLLTDDRYNKFRTFITMAVEKGILKNGKGALVKERSKLDGRSHFHRARIENPVEVMANEIEPLTTLQRHIRRLAWEPGFLLRRKIVKLLTHKALSRFEKDYERFFIEGESKKKEVGKPFLIKNLSRKMGVVLIHGYMAAPLEIRELAAYLGQKGFWVYAPRLKGHGTSPDDLATRTYIDWVESVDEGYAIVSNVCKRVVVGGFSTGGALALDLATRVKGLAGVFAVSPPIRLQNFSTKFLPAVDVWNRWMDLVGLEAAKKEFTEKHPENPHINYSRNPICGVRELGLLMDALEPRLPSIQIPALVVQSDGDPLVNPRGSRKVFELLGSEDKEYLLLNFDRHGILLGDGAHRVHQSIGNFVQRL